MNNFFSSGGKGIKLAVGILDYIIIIFNIDKLSNIKKYLAKVPNPISMCP